LTVRNVGQATEAKASISLPVPEGARVARATENGVLSETEVAWEIADLKPDQSKQVCAFFAARQPGGLAFRPMVQGLRANPVQTACSTKILGVSAILLELVDLEDPIEVGREATYEIRVTNQGSAPGTNIRLVCQLPASEEYVSGGGATAIQAQGGVITMETLPHLEPKAVASWRVVVKATQRADARFKLQLSSDQFQRPIDEEESTELY
jgi:uncharacterized repeat protein (TIGR01451 family)